MLRIRRNLILTGAVGLVLVVPYGRAQTQNAAAFEVVSVKPSPSSRGGSIVTVPQGARMTEAGISLVQLFAFAFGLQQNQISAPDWTSSQAYDIEAKTEGDVSLTRTQMQPLIQRLLADRFKLVYHRGTKELSGYALTVAKSGLKLHVAKEDSSKSIYFLRDGIRLNGTIETLAVLLENPLGQPIVDKTGLTDVYDIKLSYAPKDATDSTLPSIFTAVQEQLGLRLESQKVPVEMLVIDHVEKVPTGN
jgi:uncharacterized protein (TIGR03435 family)